MTVTNNPPAVVMKAFTWAYEELGLSGEEAAQILGVSETALYSTALVGFPAQTPESEIQLAFIRMYHLLYAVLDGDTDDMLEWFNRPNAHLGTIPKSTCNNLAGISYISDYLYSIYGDRPLVVSPFMATRHSEYNEAESVIR